MPHGPYVRVMKASSLMTNLREIKQCTTHDVIKAPLSDFNAVVFPTHSFYPLPFYMPFKLFNRTAQKLNGSRSFSIASDGITYAASNAVLNTIRHICLLFYLGQFTRSSFVFRLCAFKSRFFPFLRGELRLQHTSRSPLATLFSSTWGFIIGYVLFNRCTFLLLGYMTSHPLSISLWVWKSRLPPDGVLGLACLAMALTTIFFSSGFTKFLDGFDRFTSITLLNHFPL